ncbi:unnamed protein product, partial [Rotaria magnacalcarata]
ARREGGVVGGSGGGGDNDDDRDFDRDGDDLKLSFLYIIDNIISIRNSVLSIGSVFVFAYLKKGVAQS